MTPEERQALAAAHDLTPEQFDDLVDELQADHLGDARLAALDVVREAEELLSRVRTIWGAQRPREAHRVVLAAEDLTGQEKLMLLGYLDAVRLGVDVQGLVDRKTAAKYRRIAEGLGLDRQVRRRGALPSG